MQLGEWLVDHRLDMDRAEAEWLERLAQFDREGLWVLDGQLSCVAWLVWHLDMARSTAFEKLRVAHELERRPLIAESFRNGRLSYSMARTLTRMDRPDPAVDEAIIAAVTSGQAGIADIEALVRSYRLYGDQDRPPADDSQRSREVRIIRGVEGMGQVLVTLADVELEEVAASLQAFLDLRFRRPPVDESTAEDSPIAEAPLEEPSRSEARADAFMDMVRTALKQTDAGHVAGDDRYLVHLVEQGGVTQFLDGRSVHPRDAAMIRCDCSSVAHVLGAGGEPLHLGRKTRV